MYKTLSHNLQRGEGSVRSLSPETREYERRKNEKIGVIGSVHKGKIVEAKVVKIVEYGAFVDVKGIGGFVHISELSHKKVSDINTELKVGRVYSLKVIEVGLNKNGILALKLTRLLNRPLTDEKTTKTEPTSFVNNSFSALDKFILKK